MTVHPWEHYAAWAAAGLPAVPEPAFGEQLTSVGLSEAEVFVGDTFRWGTAEVQVSAPAVPDPGAVPAEVADRLRRSGHTGFHLRVVRAGKVGPDDLLELIDIDPAGVSLATVSLALMDGPAAAGVTASGCCCCATCCRPTWSRAGSGCSRPRPAPIDRIAVPPPGERRHPGPSGRRPTQDRSPGVHARRGPLTCP